MPLCGLLKLNKLGIPYVSSEVDLSLGGVLCGLFAMDFGWMGYFAVSFFYFSALVSLVGELWLLCSLLYFFFLEVCGASYGLVFLDGCLD